MLVLALQQQKCQYSQAPLIEKKGKPIKQFHQKTHAYARDVGILWVSLDANRDDNLVQIK